MNLLRKYLLKSVRIYCLLSRQGMHWPCFVKQREQIWLSFIFQEFCRFVALMNQKWIYLFFFYFFIYFSCLFCFLLSLFFFSVFFFFFCLMVPKIQVIALIICRNSLTPRIVWFQFKISVLLSEIRPLKMHYFAFINHSSSHLKFLPIKKYVRQTLRNNNSVCFTFSFNNEVKKIYLIV